MATRYRPTWIPAFAGMTSESSLAPAPSRGPVYLASAVKASAAEGPSLGTRTAAATSREPDAGDDHQPEQHGRGQRRESRGVSADPGLDHRILDRHPA